MKKIILFLFTAMISVNITWAQFDCQIIPKVKEAGDVMTKTKSHSKDSSIIGDYRENGTGWVLLPDHTGAVFIQNVQISQLLWALVDSEKGLMLGILTVKNELGADGLLQQEKQIGYLVNIVSPKEIDLLDSQTLVTMKAHRKKLTQTKK